MRILLVNKFHYLKGGSEKYYFDLAELLKENGNEVAFFSMEDEKNIKTDCKEYIVPKVNTNSKNPLKAFDIIYSKINKLKMEEALEEFKPDVVHINNFQRQLSASILFPIKKRGIPIIFTAHDLQSICPAITMLDSSNMICEECINGKYINCIKKKCVKNSRLKSVLGAIEGKYYRNKKIYTDLIDYIIAPSDFYKGKLLQDGIPENKIEAIHNFLDMDEFNLECVDEGYALYFGRLSKEKGVFNLIQAIQKIDKGKLFIAGTGPEKDNIENIIEENGLKERVKLLGFLDSNEMKEYIRKSKFVVVPSIWYENCPYSVMETLSIGKPVIGSNVAGIPELVKNEINGFVYEKDDIDDLANKMEKLFEDENLYKKFSCNAKKEANKLYSKEKYYLKIIKIYEKLLKNNKKGDE